ncbi:MAG TPA: alpha/beta hydrolase-fold protein [Gaiellaceae bacterium]
MSTIVLHDAQNLGAWRAEAALPEGVALLSVPHAGTQRAWEYVGDGLDDHVDRLVSLVAGASPPIGVGGSSFGAYASLYAWAQHPTLFTRVLAMSPALWVRRERLFEAARSVTPAPGTRVWIDVGGRESAEHQTEYDHGYEEMRHLLGERGCDVGGFRDPEGIHNESAWADRLPEALRFLFGSAA